MVINTRDNLGKNIMCDKLYEALIDELNSISHNEAIVVNTNQIETNTNQNPFIENQSSEESVETFIPVSDLKARIKEKVESVFGTMATEEVNRLITTIIQIKNRSFAKKTRFSFNIENFFIFLKTFFEKQISTISPIENMIQFLEMEKNRPIIEPLAIKYFKVIFYMQKPLYPSYYELSVVYNFMKAKFKDDEYIRSVLNVLLKEYIIYISNLYTSNNHRIILNLIKNRSLILNEFFEIIEMMINAFNGAIVELDVDSKSISRILYTMLCFYANKNKSEFLKEFGVHELFYCSVRSVYQGKQFAKKLECYIATMLKWKLLTHNEEYTCDKIYQTFFKYEYKKIIGKIKNRNGGYLYNIDKNEEDMGNGSSEESQKVLITKIVQTTPKIKKSEEKFAFSPLSRRIGEAIQDKEGFSSSRKLKFDK